MKKAAAERLELDLERTGDVLGALATRRRQGQVLVGFAAEHGEEGLQHARGKLRDKGLDAVVLNDVSRPDIGFDSDANEVTLVTAGEERRLARASKAEVAAGLLDAVGDLLGREEYKLH
jgi:phosphopantothenoylcysteine decarboxylase / phosphopantothenate---cysteine ligase